MIFKYSIKQCVQYVLQHAELCNLILKLELYSECVGI